MTHDRSLSHWCLTQRLAAASFASPFDPPALIYATAQPTFEIKNLGSRILILTLEPDILKFAFKFAFSVLHWQWHVKHAALSWNPPSENHN